MGFNNTITTIKQVNLNEDCFARCYASSAEFRNQRIPMKILHTKMEGKRVRGKPRTRWIDQIRKDIEMRVENWGKKYKKTGSVTVETAGNFCVIIDRYFWKGLKNGDDDDIGRKNRPANIATLIDGVISE